MAAHTKDLISRRVADEMSAEAYKRGFNDAKKLYGIDYARKVDKTWDTEIGRCKDCYACETIVTRYEEGDLYEYYCLRGKHKVRVDADHYCGYWEEGE